LEKEMNKPPGSPLLENVMMQTDIQELQNWFDAIKRILLKDT